MVKIRNVVKLRYREGRLYMLLNEFGTAMHPRIINKQTKQAPSDQNKNLDTLSI